MRFSLSVHLQKNNLVFFEIHALPIAQPPASKTFVALSAARKCIFRDVAVVFVFIKHIGDRNVIRIVRQPVAPRAKNDSQIFRKRTVLVDIFVDELVLLCEAEIYSVFAGVCHIHHPGKIRRIHNVAACVPSEEPQVESVGDNLRKIHARVVFILVQIVLMALLYIPEYEISPPRVAFLNARRIRSTCYNRRKID